MSLAWRRMVIRPNSACRPVRHRSRSGRASRRATHDARLRRNAASMSTVVAGWSSSFEASSKMDSTARSGSSSERGWRIKPLSIPRRRAHTPPTGREAGNRGLSSAASSHGRHHVALSQWRDRPLRTGATAPGKGLPDGAICLSTQAARYPPRRAGPDAPRSERADPRDAHCRARPS